MQTTTFIIGDELAIIACIYIVVVVVEGAAAAEQSRPLPFQEDPLESLAKLCVEYAVDDGVERRVGVAEPRENLERRFTDARFAEGGHNVHTEKGHPTHCGRNLIVPR